MFDIMRSWRPQEKRLATPLGVATRGVYSGCARCEPHILSQREKCMIVINKLSSK